MFFDSIPCIRVEDVCCYIKVLINSEYKPSDRIEPQIYCNRSLLFIEDNKHPQQLCYFREIYRISRRWGNYLQNNSHCQYPSTEFYCRWRWFFCCITLAYSGVDLPMVLPQFFFDIGQAGSQFNHLCWLNGDIRKVVRAKDFGNDSFKLVVKTVCRTRQWETRNFDVSTGKHRWCNNAAWETIQLDR